MSENEAGHVVGGDADDSMSVLTVRLPVTVLPVIRADTLNDAKAIDEIAVGVAEEARVVFLRQVEKARRLAENEHALPEKSITTEAEDALNSNVSPDWPFTAGETLYIFTAWLTTREQVLTLSSTHDAGAAAEVVSEFCATRGIEKPREGWEKLFGQTSKDASPPLPANSTRRYSDGCHCHFLAPSLIAAGQRCFACEYERSKQEVSK